MRLKNYVLIFSFLSLSIVGNLAIADENLPVYPTKEGTYVKDNWEYIYTITLKGTKSEMRKGQLYYNKKEVSAPLGTIKNTPLGKFILFPASGTWNMGWLNTMTYDRPVFNNTGRLTAKAQQYIDSLEKENLSSKTIEQIVIEIVKKAELKDTGYFQNLLDTPYKKMTEQITKQINNSGMIINYKEHLEMKSNNTARLNYHYLEKGCHFQIDLIKHGNNWKISRVWFCR